MARIATNKNLQEAKNEKNDEFYTILSDIERELRHYKRHFKNKVVLCNCDDPRVSTKVYPIVKTAKWGIYQWIDLLS